MQKRKNLVPCYDKQHRFEKKRKKLHVDRLSGNCKVFYLPWSYTKAVEVDSMSSIAHTTPTHPSS